jgi:glycosyltransferase involved in cell wall biosynthesis
VTLHVLYVIDSIGRSGGAEQSLATLAPVYQQLGVSLDVAYLKEREGLDEQLRADGASVHALAGRGGRAGSIARVRALARELRPDLVHTTLFEADIAGRLGARLAGTPVVSSLVNTNYEPEHRANPQIRATRLRGAQWLDAATSRVAVRLHAVSSTVADTMSHRLHYPRGRIDVVPRGRNPNRLGAASHERRAAARRALGVADDDAIVLTVGRHEYQKGIDVLIRAMPLVRRSVPNARLFVAGREGAQTQVLRKLAVAEGIVDSVVFLGARRDVPELLCAADVFVLASRHEGFPGAVLEAMALETPIVVTDLPEIRECVDSTCAVLTDRESVPAFARAVERVIADPAEGRARARGARVRFMRHFTDSAVGEEMVAFYVRALGRAERNGS